jgi:hypothetical protein
MTLPAAGRKGKVPKWPLLPDLDLTVRLQAAEHVVEQLSVADTLLSAEKRKLDNAKRLVIELTYKIENVDSAEKALWAELWKTPQAVAWDRLGYTREVAQYCRFKVYAEWGSLDAAKESRQLSDRLGLSPLAMLRLQWQIADDAAVAPKASGAGSTVTDMVSRRSRLTG